MTAQLGHFSGVRVPIIDIVVCVPTFRRPEHLALTLDSIRAQSIDRPFAVIVVENEGVERRGAAVAQGYFDDGRLNGRVVVEERQGNCFAINTAFGTALSVYQDARFVLMMDDDEIASPHWLERLVNAAERSGAEIVGGPVHPQLESGARPGLARHPAFQPAYGCSGPVPLIYGSGNCLITRETFQRLGLPAFDVGYNFLGGGDTDFFTRARRAGIAFHWEAEAEITETVPRARTTLRWLAARGLRIGAINHRIEVKLAQGPIAQLATVLKSLAALGISVPRAARLLAETREPMIALHPILVALGRCLSTIGIAPQPYRAAAAK